MITSEYTYSEDTNIHRLHFNFWVHFRSDPVEDSGLYTSALGGFTFYFKHIGGIYLFSIKTNWIDSAKLSMFTNCSVNLHKGGNISFNKVTFQPMENNSQHVVAILPSQIERTRDCLFDLDFCFSNEDIVVVTSAPSSPPLNFEEAILEKLYSDTTLSDIMFMFDTSIGQSSNETANPGSEDAAKETSQGSMLRAHRLILSQWPYFKTMFESGFSESGPGEKQIRIQDTNKKTFELLLRFMYTGRLSSDFEPKTMYSDALENKEDGSMEDLFLAADRYDLKELRDKTLRPLLKGLNAATVVPFLFRTAYMFPDLREPVVEFVAQSWGPAIPKKNIRTMYKDHPDVFDIIMDLLEAYDELHPGAKEP